MKRTCLVLFLFLITIFTSCHSNGSVRSPSKPTRSSEASSGRVESSGIGESFENDASDFVTKIDKQQALDLVLSKIAPLKVDIPSNLYYVTDLLQITPLPNRKFFAVVFLFSENSQSEAACFLVDAQTCRIYMKLWTDDVYLPFDKNKLVYLGGLDQTKDGWQNKTDMVKKILSTHGFKTTEGDNFCSCFGMVERDGQIYYVAVFDNGTKVGFTADNVYLINKSTERIYKWDIANDDFIPYVKQASN